MTRLALILTICAVALGGCGAVDDPLRVPATTELDRGLVLMYPGATSTQVELGSWYIGLREAGITAAIEIVEWGDPVEPYENATNYDLNRQRAQAQADRIVKYMDDHPGCPVTLIGYSAGAAIAAWSAEALPEGRGVDRVILMGADLSPDYDLSAMLDHTTGGGIYYWSRYDIQTPDAITKLGTMDRVFGPSASSHGFEMTDPRLIAVEWDITMMRYLNFGGHVDYLFNAPFIRDIVGPWVARGHN